MKVNFKATLTSKGKRTLKGLEAALKIELIIAKNTSQEVENKIKEHKKVFLLEDRYDNLRDRAAEIYRLKQIFSEKYLTTLSQTFDRKFNPEDLYRMAFTNYLNPQEFPKRPLSKLTRDLADDLGLH